MNIFKKNKKDSLVATFIIEQHMRIIKDSIELLHSTSNPTTFFGRHDDLMESLLTVTDQLRNVKDKNLALTITSLTEKYGSEEIRTTLTNDFLDRAIENNKTAILKQELWKYIDKMTNSSIQYAESKLGVITKPNTTFDNRYMLCFVEFEGGHKQYCYLSDDHTVQVGCNVVVPVGNYGKETEAQVVRIEICSLEEIPFASTKLKRIIRKI